LSSRADFLRSLESVDESATAPAARITADAMRKVRSSVRERSNPDER